MNFMFEWQEQYLTSERSERVRYCSCHSNIKFISWSNVQYSFYYINILMTAFLMIFRRFPTTFRRFPKIFQIVPKTRRTFPNIFREFPKISEDVRRLPSTFEEDPKMFRWYTNEFKYNLRDKPDVSEIIDIFTCKNIVFLRVFRYHISRW